MSSSPLRLSAFTLRNVLTAGDTPVRIEFGRRLTLMYGENGVGKSGFRKVLSALFASNDDGMSWDNAHWYAIPRLPRDSRHQRRLSSTAEVTFTYDTLDGGPAEFRAITLRWPGYDATRLHPLNDADPTTSDISDETIQQLVLAGTREIQVEHANGKVERVILYNPWERTTSGARLLPTRFVARCVAPEETYVLKVEPSPERGKALMPPFAHDPSQSSVVDLMQRVFDTLSAHAAPPFLVHPGSPPMYLDPIGNDAEWSQITAMFTTLWSLAAPTAPQILFQDVDELDLDDDDDAEAHVWWSTQGDAVMCGEDLSSGEQRIFALLSNVIAWHANTDPRMQAFSRHTCLLEEPETHLHPRAQGHLLRALLAIPQVALTTLEELRDTKLEEGERTDDHEDATRRLVPPAFVLETHSEAFLRAVQSALRNGALQPNDLRVNVFNRDTDTFLPSVSQAMFGDDGNLVCMWPGVFPSGSAGEAS